MLEKLTNDLRTVFHPSLGLAKVDQQYVIMADASFYFYVAGYVLMIEGCTTNEDNRELKVFAPISFGSTLFNPDQIRLSKYAKQFLAVHFVLDTFAKIIWGCKKPVLILTDNRSVTRFFQTKIIPPTLWKAIDHVLSFNIILGHITGKANLAADYLSRIHIKPKEKLELRVNSRVPPHETEINTTADTLDNSISHLSCSADDDTPKIMKT